MAIKFVKEKERQELLLYIAAFLVIFGILYWKAPPSFDFSVPETQIEERRDYYAEIKESLDAIDFNRFGRFDLIPRFEDPTGRPNPFLPYGDLVFEEEAEETIEEEEILEPEEV